MLSSTQNHSDVHIDLFEQLPTPYGLVRHGVAPDHPEVKNVTATFDSVLSHPRVRFFGNVAVGDAPGHLPLSQLRKSYQATVLAYGVSQSRELGISGENGCCQS